MDILVPNNAEIWNNTPMFHISFRKECAISEKYCSFLIFIHPIKLQQQREIERFHVELVEITMWMNSISPITLIDSAKEALYFTLRISPSPRRTARCSPHRRADLCSETPRACSSHWLCPPPGGPRSWSHRRHPGSLKLQLRIKIVCNALTTSLESIKSVGRNNTISLSWTGCKVGQNQIITCQEKLQYLQRVHDNMYFHPLNLFVASSVLVSVQLVTILPRYQWRQSVTICLDIYLRLLDTFLVPYTEREFYLNECMLQLCLTLILCNYVNPITLGIYEAQFRIRYGYPWR